MIVPFQIIVLLILAAFFFVAIYVVDKKTRKPPPPFNRWRGTPKVTVHRARKDQEK